MAESSHARVVSEWMERAVLGQGSPTIVRTFGGALLAIWDRATLTLGDVSLQMIAQRVLSTAETRFPLFRSLGVGPSPESFRTLLSREEESVKEEDLLPQVHFVLSTLLALIGALTAEILTPPLHDALSAVTSCPAPSRVTPPSPNRRIHS